MLHGGFVELAEVDQQQAGRPGGGFRGMEVSSWGKQSEMPGKR